MGTTEHTINDALAGLLRETRHAWRGTNAVNSERTGMLKHSLAQPDILIIESNVSPVVVETEVLPAITVEVDALSRIGEKIRLTGRDISSSIAVRYPERLRTKQGNRLRDELAIAKDLEMALFTGNSSSEYTRWPSAGWIPGNVSDLSVLIQSASVPPDVIEKAVDQLVRVGSK